MAWKLGAVQTNKDTNIFVGFQCTKTDLFGRVSRNASRKTSTCQMFTDMFGQIWKVKWCPGRNLIYDLSN